MKLCPQCEFIYEDDQSFCDMDGKELVSDAGTLAFEETAPSTFSQPQQLAETPVSLPSELTSNLSPVLLDSPPSREQSRSFAIAGAVAVVLVALLFVVYYALTHRPRSGNANQASSQTSVQPQDSSASPATDAQVPGPDSVAVPGSVVDSPEQALSTPPDLTLKRSQVKSIQRLAPQSEPTAVSAEEKNRKPQNAIAQNRARASRPESADAKKESKVSSFLKKTGRILKKPFQF
jgi:hypothetical protein